MKLLPLQLRFLLPLLGVLLLAAYITVPIVDRLTVRWFIRDLDTRAQLIGAAVDESVGDAIDQGQPEHARELFNRIVRDERILGVGVCNDDNHWVTRSDGFPSVADCNTLRHLAKARPPVAKLGRGLVHVAALPLDEAGGNTDDTLMLLHDMSFIEQRSEDTRKYLIWLFVVLGSVIALITVAVAQLSWRGWMSGIRALLRGEGLFKPFATGGGEFAQVADELRTMVRELEDQRRLQAGNESWTPARIRDLLRRELRGDEIMVVSNREPYIHEKRDGGIKVMRPASGLVTAVEPVMRACSGIWIAHGSGSADRDVVDAQDMVPVPPDKPSYQLKRVWLTAEDEAGYYYGFANEGLWPLCHVAHVRPVFRESDWLRYKQVNQRFADAVVASARTDDPVILVQDYHFALVPRMIREKLPRATIITFWHIPWPNPESFGICPWRDEIVDGLLGSNIVGFHTPYHCKHFLETVDSLMEARIQLEHSIVSYGGEETLVKSYPISIAWPDEEATAQLLSIADSRKQLRNRIGMPDDALVAIGVDRFDYTKGILERVNAVADLLNQHPEMVGRFCLVQIAAPTRGALDEYRNFQARIAEQVERINARYGKEGYQPIHLFTTHHDSDILQTYYRGADACAVTSLHDGMNLVAKEYIAARDDEQGVLVLSCFAGAAQELREALVVNPYHVEQTADALYRAVTMPPAEQTERMRSLRAIVQQNNVFRWAGHMLMDAAQVRLRERIQARVSAHSRSI